MPHVVDYEAVLARLRSVGLESLYFNSGAFGVKSGESTFFTGWIGPEDPTIRPAARERARMIPQPYAPTLTEMTLHAWQTIVPGELWLMPKSHWAFELDLGRKTWLIEALAQAGVDATRLQSLNNAPAIAFAPTESGAFTPLLETIIEQSIASDFTLAFPDYPMVCTVHHHKQMWWISGKADLIARVEAIARAS